MTPFLEHVEKCERCRNTPRNLCSVGYDLFERCAAALARRYDPNRAKA